MEFTMQKHYRSSLVLYTIYTTLHLCMKVYLQDRHKSPLTLRSLYANALGLQYYSINSLLYLRTVQDKYIALYKELITQQCIYATSIRILAKGYLPISLITPSKLREILTDDKTALRKTNPDYELVIDRLHLYYDMQLVTFGIDKEKIL